MTELNVKLLQLQKLQFYLSICTWMLQKNITKLRFSQKNTFSGWYCTPQQ